MGGGSRFLRLPPAGRGGALLLLLLAGVFLLPSCASTSTGEGGEGVTVSRGSALGDLLPEPFGRVRFDEDPALFAAGWLGMIAGAVAAGWGFSLAVRDGSGNGEAIFYGGLLVVALGAFIGGLLFALPVKGIQEFFKWRFG